MIERIHDYLEQSHVPYHVVTHPPAFSSQHIAHAAHISGKKIAKPVIVKVDGELVMIVIPAHRKINLETLQGYFKTDDVTLASEGEFREVFGDCEMGGIPPFGHLYDIDVYVARELASGANIAFNAGSLSELVLMSYGDYAKLVHPDDILPDATGL